MVANAPPEVRQKRPDEGARVEAAVARMLAKLPVARFGTLVAFVREVAAGWQRVTPRRPPGVPTLVVDRAGHGSHRTIREATLATIVPGTLISVRPGICREALVIDLEVEIVGERDRDRIVVDATDTNAVKVTAERAVVRNLPVGAVRSGAASGAVCVKRGGMVIDGCDLTSAIGAVVDITGAGNPVIRGCDIRDGKDFGV